MKFRLENYIFDNCKYDTLIQPTDWRYSAAIVGLIKYLENWQKEEKNNQIFKYELLFNISEKDRPDEAIKDFDGILYNSDAIDEERFLLFTETEFEDDMTHRSILKILDSNDFNQDKIKSVNEMIKSKKVLKSIFGEVKFDGTNADFYKQEIEKNRFQIIKEIFCYGKNLYSNYCNTNLLFTDENPHCRLVGYNVDENRKTKFLGFCFDKDSFVGNDIKEFDFIPFAFTKTFESFFINNNYDIKNLLKSNNELVEGLEDKKGETSRYKFLSLLKDSKDYINFDVEVITKKRDRNIYETLLVRLERLEALRNLNNINYMSSYKINSNYWLNLQQEVYEHCLNNVLLDDLIEKMFKNFSTAFFDIRRLIRINVIWKGEITLKKVREAEKQGYEITKKLSDMHRLNSINSFKQKLISALVAHDGDRVKDIILKLSDYSGVECKFIYDLLEDFESNRDIALAFTNALGYTENEEKINNEVEENV